MPTMTMWRRTAGLIVLIAGIAFALLHLNSFLFSLWASGVPHGDENPDLWTFVAYSHLGWAVAAALGGIGVFFATRQPPRIRTACVLIGLAVLCFVLPWAREFIASDRCLDAGGNWSESELQCQFGDP
jgi:hypothetical protein